MQKSMKSVLYAAIALFAFFACPSLSAESAIEVCPRPAAGSVVAEPEDLRSQNGVLEAELTIHNVANPDGSVRYCYTDAAGRESPNLRVSRGDLVILHLKNALSDPGSGTAPPAHTHSAKHGKESGQASDACASGVMSAVSTNLHFHGLTIPPVCHQDEVLRTSVQPGDPAFEYRFRIPDDEPPGLYWYHPHIHGFSKVPILGGASGALIVEGIERAEKAAAGLPERVFVIRDQDLVNPNAPPAKSEPVVPKFLIDRDGDAANTGTGFGKPAKDLSINYVPVPYPDYPPATIQMRPGERQLWRVLNASAITYLNLAVLFDRAPQPLELVAMDGVPMGYNDPTGDAVGPQNHIALPPGARVEFVVTGPPEGRTGLLVTRTVDTGPGGENDPNRALAIIVPSPSAPEPRSKLDGSPEPLPPPREAWLGNVAPVRVRRLYFSEKLAVPNDPTSAVEFYLTVDGQEPKMFDMSSGVPDIVAPQGTVEDWIIENRSNELHAFHIHQLHFLLLDYMGRPVNETFLRDTVNVPYYNGRDLAYPSVRLRMDFRDPNTVGNFVYHCHLLEHEDKGMMGSIRVDPPPHAPAQTAEGPCKGGIGGSSTCSEAPSTNLKTGVSRRAN
jgi:FtsP/CotA-like multicopper oxidase with cupredoxin domain